MTDSFGFAPPRPPQGEHYKRRRLAWLGTIIIGGLIIIIWLIIWPYTSITNQRGSLFTTIQNQWQKITAEQKKLPAVDTFQLIIAQVNDQVAATNKQIVVDPEQNFIITPPKSWRLTELQGGRVMFIVNSSNSSSSIIWQYPQKYFGIVINTNFKSNQITQWQNYPAMSVLDNNEFKFINQRPLGYLSILGTGPQAAGLINELLNEVQFIR